MKKFSIFLIIFVAFVFNVCVKVQAVAAPISEIEIDDEHDIENFIDYAKRTRSDEGIKCNIYGGKFYKDQGRLYWKATFGQNTKNFVKFKINDKNYIDWATINRYMPQPTKDSWQEYSMETLIALQEIKAIEGAFMEEIMLFHNRDWALTIENELNLALQKIKEQVEQGTAITPYDNTSFVYIDEVNKTFKTRVYWSESLIHLAIQAKSGKFDLK